MALCSQDLDCHGDTASQLPCGGRDLLSPGAVGVVKP